MKHWNDGTKDALDARIDASLARTFAPPERLEFHPPAPQGGAPTGGSRFVPWMLAAGITAVVGAFALRALGGAPERTTRTAEVALVEATTGAPERPDLAELYDAIHEIPAPVAGCDAEAEDLSDGVADTLASRCGASIELEPEAASLLVGPFSSDVWPTGTVLAGYPDGPDQAPVVIVAECADYQDCCIDLGAATTAGLQHFSANVGGVALTEITPHAEPRMLALLAARR